jgi:hypothetical protein
MDRPFPFKQRMSFCLWAWFIANCSARRASWSLAQPYYSLVDTMTMAFMPISILVAFISENGGLKFASAIDQQVF